MANITSELEPLLSPDASVLLPGTEPFDTAAARWGLWSAPHLDVIVEARTEGDVERTIQYANKNQKPFLAIVGKHGSTSALANVKSGVGISLREMRDVKIAADGKSAMIGGGITSGDLLDVLWSQGKQAVVGGCEATGAVAPMLGGGHGWLQGHYGLMADNLISTRVVLADGTTVTASNEENPNLFWALRGAGHNFGIVASFQYKIYNRTPENEMWTYEMLVFGEDKLEQVYEESNKMLGSRDRPVELVHWSMIMRLPDVSPEKPVIVFYVIYQGRAVPSQYVEPFTKIQPIFSLNDTVTLPGLAKPLYLSSDSIGCALGSAWQRFPVGMQSYDIPALRKAYGLLESLPTKLHGTFYMLEAYATQAVQAVLSESTAFPDRENDLLVGVMMPYGPGSTESDAEAAKHGQAIREVLLKGTGKPLNAYVNYAHGDESLGEIYGHEEWRLEKLRRLKKAFDPHGRFNYYCPIR